MEPTPALRTDRLVLRGFLPEDAPEVGRILGAWELARALLVVPHPLEEGWAERFVEASLRGDVLLKPNPRDDNAELAYFVGVPYWGRGYATEAVREVVRYGFEELGLHRIHSDHFGDGRAFSRDR